MVRVFKLGVGRKQPWRVSARRQGSVLDLHAEMDTQRVSVVDTGPLSAFAARIVSYVEWHTKK